MARLRETYKDQVVPALMEKFQYESIMQAPKVEKIIINMGVGEAKENQKFLDKRCRRNDIDCRSKTCSYKSKKINI